MLPVCLVSLHVVFWLDVFHSNSWCKDICLLDCRHRTSAAKIRSTDRQETRAIVNLSTLLRSFRGKKLSRLSVDVLSPIDIRRTTVASTSRVKDKLKFSSSVDATLAASTGYSLQQRGESFSSIEGGRNTPVNTNVQRRTTKWHSQCEHPIGNH